MSMCPHIMSRLSIHTLWSVAQVLTNVIIKQKHNYALNTCQMNVLTFLAETHSIHDILRLNLENWNEVPVTRSSSAVWRRSSSSKRIRRSHFVLSVHDMPIGICEIQQTLNCIIVLTSAFHLDMINAVHMSRNLLILPTGYPSPNSSVQVFLICLRFLDSLL